MGVFYGTPPNGPWSQYRNITATYWYNDAGLRLNVFMIFSLFMVQVTDGYDKSLTSGIQALPAWLSTMGHPGSTTIGLINSAVAFGGIVSSAPTGWIMDHWGRKAAIWFGTALFLIGSIMSMTANSFPVFVGGRAILGAGIASELTCAPVLVQEISHPRYRALVTALYNVMFNVGAIIVAYIAYGTSYLGPKNQYSWRIPAILQIVPTLYVISILHFIPESPRWLISKGRKDEAHAMLAKHHANGALDDELVLFELKEIEDAIAEVNNSNASWLHCLRTVGNRRRFFLITMVSVITNWNGKAIVTYYFAQAVKLVGITDAHAVTGLNAGINVFNLGGNLIGAGLVDSVGRRNLWLFAFIFMLGADVIQTAAAAVYAHTKGSAAAAMTIVGLFLYSFGFDVAANPLLFVYEIEIMPFYLRSYGSVYGVTLNNIQGVAATYLNPIGLANLTWKYYCVYMGLLVAFIAIIYLYFPETTGRTLEEVAELFDGKESLMAIAQKTAKEHKARIKGKRFPAAAEAGFSPETPDTFNEKEKERAKESLQVPILELDSK